ncbi:MAG: glycosyltransferase family 2 protein [Candidatus Auribacterota bacterium]|nr:glycosyltransferase family 2 protein [Candidatus Auribacterota bacterium]
MKKMRFWNKPEISVIMPALNEEANILSAIDNVLKAFEYFDMTGEIIVVNDGSKDRTGELVNGMIEKGKPVNMIRHSVPCGIGASFWEGLDNVSGDVVIMFPGDNENDPWEIFRYHELLKHVDIVIPFVFNKEVRSLFRNALSFAYRFIINTTFLVNLNYTNGTILYRKSILKDLNHRDNGFFFQTDILIRAVKKGYLFAEVPYRLGLRANQTSKAVSFPSLLQVMRGYLRLVRSHYLKKDRRKKKRFSKDSLTEIRRQIKK